MFGTLTRLHLASALAAGGAGNDNRYMKKKAKKAVGSKNHRTAKRAGLPERKKRVQANMTPSGRIQINSTFRAIDRERLDSLKSDLKSDSVSQVVRAALHLVARRCKAFEGTGTTVHAELDPRLDKAAEDARQVIVWLDEGDLDNVATVKLTLNLPTQTATFRYCIRALRAAVDKW